MKNRECRRHSLFFCNVLMGFPQVIDKLEFGGVSANALPFGEGGRA